MPKRSSLLPAITLATLVLSACGGGGGDSGGGGGSGPGPSSPPVDPDAPTAQIVAGTSQLGIDVLEAGGRVLDFAQFSTDIVHRFASEGSTAAVSANCAYAGKLTLQLDDRDGNRRASPGDVITVALDNCGVPVMKRALHGSLQLQLLQAGASAATDFRARVTVSDTLKIAKLAGGPNIGVIEPASLQGSMDVQWAETARGSQLQALSSTADDLRLTTTVQGANLLNTIRKITVSRAISYEGAAVSSSLAFIIAPGGASTLRVTTPLPFQGDFNVLPRQFRVDAEGAGGARYRMEVNKGEVTVPYATVKVLDGNGGVASQTTIGWGQFLTVMDDVRQNRDVATYSDQGGGVRSIMSWRDQDLMNAVDSLCMQDHSAGVKRYRADAVFQRPVAAPSLMEPGALIRVQLGAAIADSTPALQFRLRDAAPFQDEVFPHWGVAASVVRYGSSYEVRPAEPLRGGREYILESSTDGLVWDGPRVFYDAQGKIVTSGSSTMGSVRTDSSLVLSAIGSDSATVSPLMPARLRGSAALRDGQSVVRYRWEQLSGVPVRFITPEAAETDLVQAADGPQLLGEAVVQLSATDSLGHTDRLRVVLKVGTHLREGAAYYSERSRATPSFSRREMVMGPGSFFYGPTPGAVYGRVVALDAGGTGALFSVTPAFGARLAVGVFSAARGEVPPPGEHGLVAGAYCETPGSPVRSSYQVHEVEYAADGRIARLAIDFVQRCEASFGEAHRGSYRFNSSVPFSP